MLNTREHLPLRCNDELTGDNAAAIVQMDSLVSRHALADLVLFAHFAFVAFVVGGLAAIWLGAALGWRWVRGWRFRIAHFAAISFVAAEALLGVLCPLTVWEDALRGRGSEVGFIARWVRSAMFYELPNWVFTTAYVLFAAVVALTFWLVPPERKPRSPPSIDTR